jgi:hypothetical protein
VHELDGYRRAGQTFLRDDIVQLGASGGFGGKHDEQRAQPLATGHDRRAGMVCEGGSGGGGNPLQVLLDTGHPPAQPLAAFVEERLDRVATPAAIRIGIHLEIGAGTPGGIASCGIAAGNGGAVVPAGGRTVCGGRTHRRAQLSCAGTVPW